ncbi:MAG TPA: sigma 54-interacting transcriptional regulator [Acidimicrobiia bacterium]|nr:sigma 54-interacting transcriptional regulator [Acidimicrobiia bacterium]
MTRPGTLGELRASGWESRPVKDEIRANSLSRIADGKPLVDGIIGFDDTVLPQLENALLAAHDVIFLGERGQAKTRIIRSLVELLDEWTPTIAGSEINDDPYAPISQHARLLHAERGEDTPIEWVHRERRFGEKLATPDTSVADLIGEVDPIKVAEGRYLADELTIHYGLVPRTNRGIFSLNELPDLAERIQVGLLNVLEERDVQIRGYKIRLPLDLMLVASANPEDYTNRGRIITPLKDRFGAQIRTHYPLDVDVEMDVVAQEARPLTAEQLSVHVPEFMAEIVSELSQQARRSPHINQRSGVSVRMSITNYETLVANASRRALRNGEREVVPRVSDLDALVSSTAGKIEFETLDDGREEQVLERIVKASVLEVFRARCRPERLTALVGAFDVGLTVNTGEDVASSEYASLLSKLSGLREALADLGVGETPAGVASAVEFVLEGLHLSKRLNKDAVGGKAVYRGRG